MLRAKNPTCKKIFFCVFFFSSSALAANSNYTCFDYQNLGAVTDVLLDAKQICTHPGAPVQRCSGTKNSIANQTLEKVQSGKDNFGSFIEIRSTSRQGVQYLIIYDRPFVESKAVPNGTLYRARALGPHLQRSLPQRFNDPIVAGDFVCSKKQ